MFVEIPRLKEVEALENWLVVKGRVSELLKKDLLPSSLKWWWLLRLDFGLGSIQEVLEERPVLGEKKGRKTQRLEKKKKLN